MRRFQRKKVTGKDFKGEGKRGKGGGLASSRGDCIGCFLSHCKEKLKRASAENKWHVVNLGPKKKGRISWGKKEKG